MPSAAPHLIRSRSGKPPHAVAPHRPFQCQDAVLTAVERILQVQLVDATYQAEGCRAGSARSVVTSCPIFQDHLSGSVTGTAARLPEAKEQSKALIDRREFPGGDLIEDPVDAMLVDCTNLIH